MQVLHLKNPRYGIDLKINSLSIANFLSRRFSWALQWAVRESSCSTEEKCLQNPFQGDYSFPWLCFPLLFSAFWTQIKSEKKMTLFWTLHFLALTKTTDTFNKNKRCHMTLEGLSSVCAKLEPSISENNKILEISVLQIYIACSLFCPRPCFSSISVNISFNISGNRPMASLGSTSVLRM